MTLQKWAEGGWLRAEPTSRDEIRSLLGIVDRDLRDAAVETVSEDRRFEAAFNAGRTAATVALRASGYRTTVQVGHHMKAIDSLELTIHAEPQLIRRMSVFSKKRNATSYDSAGNVSRQELDLAIATAIELRTRVLDWLRENYPELSAD